MTHHLPDQDRLSTLSSTVSFLVALTAVVLIIVPASAQDLVQDVQQADRIGEDDVWIVSLGDSFSSGEGNPENIGAPINDWKWIDEEKCHRSSHAWPYEVARRLGEESQPVKFTFLACSGAELDRGLLRSYTSRDFTRPPQLDRLREMIDRSGRTPDVVLLSGGGNDIGFSDIVIECLTPGGCPGGDATEDAAETRRNLLLDPEDGRYDKVADELDDMGVRPEQVVLLQYPNPLKGKKRNVLGKWSDLKVLAACHLPRGKKAWGWASRNVVEPLQSLQETVASREGWRLLDGHVEDFQRHSYCPRNAPYDSWWVGVISEFVRQWGIGAFHPNRRGHLAMANAALSMSMVRGWDLEAPAAKLPEGAKGWYGTYEGRNDGRRARLDLRPDAERMRVEITFEDLDRGTELSSTVYPSQFEESPVHILEDLELTNGGCTSWSPEGKECVRKTIDRLFLHTWDENHISGYSEWKDTYYGMAFSKRGVSSSARPGGKLDRSRWPYEWTGNYEGRQDGREAKLTIEQEGSRLRLTLEGVQSGMVFTGSVGNYSQPLHALENIELTSDGGDVKRIERLLLHTWDTNYISGHSQWKGTDYGNYFVRTETP